MEEPIERHAPPPAAATPPADDNGLKPQYANSWAVVIGVNDYQVIEPRLQHAVDDAVGIAEVLVAKMGFARDRVLAILDPPPERANPPYTLVDGKATKRAIEGLLFSDLPSRVTSPDDRVLIFFAGHGESRALPNQQKKGYLVPADALPGKWHTHIEMDNLIEAANYMPAKHVFYLMDACFSGLAITRSSIESSAYEETMLRSRARQALTAGTARQAVGDKGATQHSPFTETVLRGLQGDAAHEGSDVITATDLIAFVKREVGERFNQTPDYGALPGHESGGDFVFRLPAASTLMDGQDHLRIGQSLYDLGWMLNSRGRFEAAARQFEETLRAGGMLARDIADVQTRLGKALWAAGRADEAVAVLLKIDPNAAPPERALYLGAALADFKQGAAAAEELASFAAANPMHPQAGWAASFATALSQNAHGKVRALLIGINVYDPGNDDLNLDGCVNDVRLIRAALSHVFGAEDLECVELIDAAATRDRIRSEFARLHAAAGPLDTVVVLFSGRGADEGFGFVMDEDPSASCYLWPSDLRIVKPKNAKRIEPAQTVRNAISAEELHTMLSAIGAGLVLVLLDTSANQTFVQLARQSNQYAVLLATEPGKMAGEGEFELDGKPVNAGALSGALSEQIARANPDTLTFAALVAATDQSLNKRDADQHPMFIGKPDALVFRREDIHHALFTFSHTRAFPGVDAGWLERLWRKGESLQVAMPALELSFGEAYAWNNAGSDAVPHLERARKAPELADEAAFWLFIAALDGWDIPTALKRLGAARQYAQMAPAIAEQFEALLTRMPGTPRHALLVGAGKPAGPAPKKTSREASDIQEFGAALIAKAGFAPDNVVALLDTRATRQSVLEACATLAAISKTETTLFCFAGGVMPQADGPAVFVCGDGAHVTIDEIRQAFQPRNDMEDDCLIGLIDARMSQARPAARARKRANQPEMERPDPEQPDGFDPEILRIGPMAVVAGELSTAADQPVGSAASGGMGKASGLRLFPALARALDDPGPIYGSWLDQAGRLGAPQSMQAAGNGLNLALFQPRGLVNAVSRLVVRAIELPAENAVTVLKALLARAEARGLRMPETLLNLGIALLSSDRAQEAVEPLARAVAWYEDDATMAAERKADPRADERLAEALSRLGEAQFSTWRATEAEGLLEAAIGNLKHAIVLQPGDASAYYHLGYALSAQAERDILAPARDALEQYLNHGAPLGDVDGVRYMLDQLSSSAAKSAPDGGAKP